MGKMWLKEIKSIEEGRRVEFSWGFQEQEKNGKGLGEGRGLRPLSMPPGTSLLWVSPS